MRQQTANSPIARIATTIAEDATKGEAVAVEGVGEVEEVEEAEEAMAATSGTSDSGQHTPSLPLLV